MALPLQWAVWLNVFIAATSLKEAGVAHSSRQRSNSLAADGSYQLGMCEFGAFKKDAGNLKAQWKEAVSRIPTDDHVATFLRAVYKAKSKKVVPSTLLVGHWCSITAFNPMGQLAEPSENAASNKMLQKRLSALQPTPLKVLPTWSGEGDWREDGFTVQFRTDDATEGRAALIKLGQEFCQGALYCFSAEQTQGLKQQDALDLVQEVVPCFEETRLVASSTKVVAISQEEALEVVRAYSPSIYSARPMMLFFSLVLVYFRLSQ
mmetsp:Transcript_53588/g.83440  ORF Transcript_53588/g.83440 Transcript_53588/m.83440 type:complete len:263 (+) Transcript_53588:1-789(+)